MRSDSYIVGLAFWPGIIPSKPGGPGFFRARTTRVPLTFGIVYDG